MRVGKALAERRAARPFDQPHLLRIADEREPGPRTQPWFKKQSLNPRLPEAGAGPWATQRTALPLQCSSAGHAFRGPFRTLRKLSGIGAGFRAYRSAGTSLVIARHRRSPAPDSQIQEAASAQRMSTTASQGGMSERSSVLATR